MTIHHIGYLVSNIRRALPVFLELGYDIVQERVYDEEYGADIIFIRNGGYLIELVAPVTEDSVVRGIKKRYKNSPYHICYECEDIDAARDTLRKSGYVIWAPVHTAPALDGGRVCFMVHPHMGMLELYQRADQTSPVV